MSRALLQQALDLLSDAALWSDENERNRLTFSIKEELANPEPEPIIYKFIADKDVIYIGSQIFSIPKGSIRLYTSPPQQKPLSYGEIEKIFIESRDYALKQQEKWSIKDFARAIEKYHGIT